MNLLNWNRQQELNQIVATLNPASSDYTRDHPYLTIRGRMPLLRPEIRTAVAGFIIFPVRTLHQIAANTKKSCPHIRQKIDRPDKDAV